MSEGLVCRYDCIVIGLGGHGSATLYHLAKRGVKVSFLNHKWKQHVVIKGLILLSRKKSIWKDVCQLYVPHAFILTGLLSYMKSPYCCFKAQIQDSVLCLYNSTCSALI